MQDYVQYAIIKFIVIYENTVDSIYARNTVTLPYSVASSTLTKQPYLCITTSLAFVVFNRSVVVVSSDKSSIFEERIDLSGTNDCIVHLSTHENADKTMCSATLFTLSSGTIKLDVDITKIKSPDIT